MVHQDAEVRLCIGLKAPMNFDLTSPAAKGNIRHISVFILCWCRVSGMDVCVVGQTILPLTAPVAIEATNLLLAWLRNYADWISFPRLHRLMGLCNLLGKGDWDLWGGPLGNAKSRVKKAHSPG